MAAAEGAPDLPELLPGLEQALQQATKATNNLLDPADYLYFRNFEGFQQRAQEASECVQRLLEQCHVLARRANLVPVPTWQPGDEEPGGDAARYVTKLLDDVLERVDSALDAEADVVRRRQQGEAAPRLATTLPSFLTSAAAMAGSAKFSTAPQRYVASLPRPQDAFEDRVDNSDAPFVPRLPPALLEVAEEAAAAGTPAARIAAYAQRIMGPAQGTAAAPSAHPLAPQLHALRYEPWQLTAEEPIPPRDMAGTPLHTVDTVAALEQMAADLAGARHIAIDLEAHSYRSYQGFTCLMQLSTRSADYLVDVLALRPHVGPALARLFADPSVVKVLHGADSDVVWLQRDFGLYIVNMFDTGQAARVLEYPSAGLAHLLQHFVGFSADKRYQLADWRIRPLTPGMVHYARYDTHFLLYVYDRLKQELVAAGEKVPNSFRVPQSPGVSQGALGTVLERSRQLCLQQYQKPAFYEGSYLEAAQRWQLALPPAQMAVFAGLFAWRDKLARDLDEGVQYVLPKVQLIELARASPGTLPELRRALGRGASPVILSRTAEVLTIIRKALQQVPPPAAPAATQAAPAAAAAAAAQTAATKAQRQAWKQAFQSGVLPSGSTANEASTSANGAAPSAAEAGAQAASQQLPGPADSAAAASAATAAAPPLLQPKALKPLVAKGSVLGGLGMMFGKGPTGGAKFSSLAGTFGAPKQQQHQQQQQEEEAAPTTSAGDAAAAGAAEPAAAAPHTTPTAATVSGTSSVPQQAAEADTAQAGAGASASVQPSAAPQSETVTTAAHATAAAAAAVIGGPFAGKLVTKAPAAKATSSLAGLLGKRPAATMQQQQQLPGSAAEAVKKLRGSFTLSFMDPAALQLPADAALAGTSNGDASAAGRVAGAGAAAGAAGTSAAALAAGASAAVSPAVEGSAAEGALQCTTAQQVRDVVAQLRATAPDHDVAPAGRGTGASTSADEQAMAEDGGPAKRQRLQQQQHEEEPDYIPMSDEYNLPRSRKQRAAGGQWQQQQQGQGQQGQQRQQGRQGANGRGAANAQEQQLQQAYADAGLGDDVSDGSSGSSEEDDADLALGEATARAAARKRRAAAEKLRVSAGGKADGQHARPWSFGDVQPFDYALARKEQQQQGRGSGFGGRGSGFGGRGEQGGARGRGRYANASERRKQAQATTASLVAARSNAVAAAAAGRGGGGSGKKPAFSPFALSEDLIKGGKRSATMPRSGNKSSTFIGKQ